MTKNCARSNCSLEQPTAGSVMRGSGGARKIRFAPSGRGKLGAYRVVYGYFAAHAHVYFLLMFGKNEQASLSASESAACQRLMAEINAYLAKGTRR